MSKLIWTLFPRNDLYGLYTNTYHLALQNIAKYFGHKYHAAGIDSAEECAKTFLLPDVDDPIIFMLWGVQVDERWQDVVFAKCPNAKLIVLGSDTIYYDINSVAPPGNRYTLFIEDIKSQVKLLSETVPSEHLYWTLSEDIINKIQADTTTYERKYSCICMCTASGARSGFFGSLGHTILYNLNEPNWDNVIAKYKQCNFCIGTTSPCAGFGDGKARSMKGMRDWIGAFCGTLLLSDDYPDMIDIGEDIVPIYPYENSTECAALIQKFLDDPVLYQTTLKNQQRWLLKHTMEKQLIRIMLKHKLL